MTRTSGLGKTLEAIATVLLHPRSQASKSSEAEVQAVKLEDMDTGTDAEDGSGSDKSYSYSEPGSRKRRKTGVDTRVTVEIDTQEHGYKGSRHWDDNLKLYVHEIKASSL